YGENPQSDVRYSNHRMDGPVSVFDVVINSRKTGARAELKGLRLPMPGRHNVSNAVAAIAVAYELGLTPEQIATGLGQFGGVKRRFTHTGTWNGAEIFDDYGHHPVEIKAVLSAARDACPGRVIAVHQPHRYSRLSSLFDDFSGCFNDANTVILAPVYSAGEDPIEGVDSAHLVSSLKAGGHRDARLIDGPTALAPMIAEIAKPGDYVVCLGAGTITQWANQLPKELASLKPDAGGSA
ncbi:MAG: cyanophycin synthetase, partial [Hoeflea sp.]